MEKIEAVDLAKKVSSVSCLYGINFIWSVRQEDLTKKIAFQSAKHRGQKMVVNISIF